MKLGVRRLIALAQSPAGRIAGGLVGLLAVALLVRHTGVDAVARALARGAHLLPFILLGEIAILACTLCALRTLYGDARRAVPLSAWVRSGLIGYAVMGLVPAGRTAAEAMRAALLARYVGAARAAAAATRLQGVALIGNAAISLPAAWAAYHLLGPSLVPGAIVANGALVFVLGGAILLAGRRLGFGAFLGRRSTRAQAFGQAFDDHLRGEPLLPARAIGWEALSRCVQVSQCALLLSAVGGVVGIGQALRAEGVLLVGGALGDLVPAQLGVTEATYTLSSKALLLSASDAMAIALLAHLAQLFWVAVGSLVPLVWPAAPDAATQQLPAATQ